MKAKNRKIIKIKNKTVVHNIKINKHFKMKNKIIYYPKTYILILHQCMSLDKEC